MRYLSILVAVAVLLACGKSSEVPLTAGGGAGIDAGSPGNGSGSSPDAGAGSGAGSTGGGGGQADAGTGSGGGGTADSGVGGETDTGSGNADAGSGNADAGSGNADAGTGSGGGNPAPAGVLTSGEKAIGLAVDATNVYWLNVRLVPTTGQTYRYIDIRTMPKSGGAPTTLARTQSPSAQSLIADSGTAYWSGANCSQPCDYPGAGSERGIFSTDPSQPDGYCLMTSTIGDSDIAVGAAEVFGWGRDPESGRYNLLGCARDHSGCHTVLQDPSPAPVLAVDSDRLIWIHDRSDVDTSAGTLFWADATPPYTRRGEMAMTGGNSAIRVDGDAIAVRPGARIWTGTLGGAMTRVWDNTNSIDGDIDISHGRMYWNQSPFWRYGGCLGSAKLDGTDGKCLDQGQHTFGGVRVDELSVWYLRDGEVARLPR